MQPKLPSVDRYYVAVVNIILRDYYVNAFGAGGWTANTAEQTCLSVVRVR